MRLVFEEKRASGVLKTGKLARYEYYFNNFYQETKQFLSKNPGNEKNYWK